MYIFSIFHVYLLHFSSGIDDLFKVKNEVYPVAVRWRFFALTLGMSPNTLEVIECDNRHSVEDCLESALREWLRSVSTPRGVPSWEMIVEAVGHRVGGNNMALAQKIAKKYNGMHIMKLFYCTYTITYTMSYYYN